MKHRRQIIREVIGFDIGYKFEHEHILIISQQRYTGCYSAIMNEIRNVLFANYVKAGRVVMEKIYRAGE